MLFKNAMLRLQNVGVILLSMYLNNSEVVNEFVLKICLVPLLINMIVFDSPQQSVCTISTFTTSLFYISERHCLSRMHANRVLQLHSKSRAFTFKNIVSFLVVTYLNSY